MGYKGIIFDLDGTLLDTIEDIGDSMNQVLEELGRETYSYEDYKLKVGGGFRNLVKNCLEDSEDSQEIDRVLELYKKAYTRNYMNKSRPYKGITELLEELARRQVPVGINTNKGQEYSLGLVEKLFPEINFVKIVGQTEEIPRKPDPKGAGLVLKAMGLEKEEVIYVGDSNVDMETGRNLGLKTVGVDWGFRGEEELRSYAADYIVYRPEEILKLIK